jgi:hypothetical protein
MSKKIALCFIISYEHILYKETIWKEWIEPNKDIINVYFFYSDLKKIRSPWIYGHTIPQKFIRHTSYYHVIPAYLSILNFALMHDKKNTWFCYLTDSCCPIISPKKFRDLFEKNYNKSVMKHARAHWNIEFHRRANLALIPKEYHLANDPWFVLTREQAIDCINFAINENNLCNLICQGGLANESLFAIILMHYKKIINVISEVTHITDWVRMSSPTSPHMFKEGNELDIAFIRDNLEKNKYAMFIRKVHPSFPDEILREFIYKNGKEDNEDNGQNGYLFNTYFSRNIVYITNLTPFFIGIFIGFLFLYVQIQYFLQ